jgi:outer membrane protein assembly factor BamB
MTPKPRIITLLLLLAGSPAAVAQNGPPVITDRGDLQRTGVYASTPIAAPGEKLWQSDKLFVMKRSTTTISGGPRWDYSRGDSPLGGVIGGGGSTINNYGFYYLNPVVHEGVVYFSLYLGDGYLFAVDANTGKLKWKSTRERERFGPPTIVGDTMYFGSSYLFHAINLKTHQELWNFPADGYAPARAAPLVVNGLVFVGSSSGKFLALDAATGDRKWFIQGEEGVFWRPAAYGDNRIFCAQGKGGIHAVNAETGKELWKVDEAKGVFTLLLNGSTLFYADDDGFMHALDAVTGSARIGFQPKNRSGTHLAAVGDKLYFGGRDTGSIFAIDAVTGAKAWKFDNSNDCREPAIAGNVIYVTCTDQKVYALDAATGKKLWSKDTGQERMSAPVIAGGALYFIADDGKVHAVK